MKSNILTCSNSKYSLLYSLIYCAQTSVQERGKDFIKDMKEIPNAKLFSFKSFVGLVHLYQLSKLCAMVLQ